MAASLRSHLAIFQIATSANEPWQPRVNRSPGRAGRRRAGASRAARRSGGCRLRSADRVPRHDSRVGGWLDSTPAAGCGAAVVIGVARVVFGRVRDGQQRRCYRGQRRGVCRIGARARGGSVAVRSGADVRRHDGSGIQRSIWVCRCPRPLCSTGFSLRLRIWRRRAPEWSSRFCRVTRAGYARKAADVLVPLRKLDRRSCRHWHANAGACIGDGAVGFQP